MNFLITRCTTYDMAGMAMIIGAATGLRTFYPDAQFGALVFAKNKRVQSPDEFPYLQQFVDPLNVAEAIDWADCCIDLGGLCKGYDPYRDTYIKLCRAKDIPYIYLAVSFEHPDAAIVKDVPAVARGCYAADQYRMVTGKWPKTAPDMSFLVKPFAYRKTKSNCFITYNNKPWGGWINKKVWGDNGAFQVVFKPPDKNLSHEPLLGMRVYQGNPQYLYGRIASSSRVYTCRYHGAVAAILAGVPYEMPRLMPNLEKYQDLALMAKSDKDTLIDGAMDACKFVKGVLDGH